MYILSELVKPVFLSPKGSVRIYPFLVYLKHLNKHLKLHKKSAFFAVLQIQMRDPVLFRSLDPGWEKIKIRIRDEYPGSYFREIRNNF